MPCMLPHYSSNGFSIDINGKFRETHNIFHISICFYCILRRSSFVYLRMELLRMLLPKPPNPLDSTQISAFYLFSLFCLSYQHIFFPHNYSFSLCRNYHCKSQQCRKNTDSRDRYGYRSERGNITPPFLPFRNILLEL